MFHHTHFHSKYRWHSSGTKIFPLCNLLMKVWMEHRNIFVDMIKILHKSSTQGHRCCCSPLLYIVSKSVSHRDSFAHQTLVNNQPFHCNTNSLEYTVWHFHHTSENSKNMLFNDIHMSRKQKKTEKRGTRDPCLHCVISFERIWSTWIIAKFFI